MLKLQESGLIDENSIVVCEHLYDNKLSDTYEKLSRQFPDAPMRAFDSRKEADAWLREIADNPSIWEKGNSILENSKIRNHLPFGICRILLFGEIRSLQRTELMEVGEYFDPEKQVGSSTMPHKMNPITAERICGVARIVKSYVNAALDNNPLWHERDLTNSSCERIMFPESCILTDYILNLTIKLMNNLVFYDENIERNLNLTNGLIMAERLMAELTRAGMGKQTAYGIVRKNAIKANKEKLLLGELILEDEEVQKYLTQEDVDKIMDPHTYTGSIPTIIDELLEKSESWF